MRRLITIKSMPVLTLVLLVVLGSSFVTGTAQDLEPGAVSSAGDTVTAGISGNLHATIFLHSVEADIAAIEEHMDLYALGMTTGDLDLWMSLYTEDTVKMAPDAPAVFGKEALRASMEPLFEAFTFEDMDIFDVEIQLAGDYAFARCNFTATMIPKAGGEPAYIDGKDVSIMQRQPDGSWKLHWDCWNSNVPPAQ
ncbi:MAG: YybH family protein [Planctomycetota bacterium]